jgi:uncharacterized protein (TIGR02677 family)
MTQPPIPKPFAHVHADKSELYRRVMGVFVAAKQRFIVHLRPEDIVDALSGAGAAPDSDEVVAGLAQLVAWGNLRADPDTARVTTVDDFYRARFLYQLTPEGEAAELALAAYDKALGQRGELQAVALEDIRVRLHSLRREAATAVPDPGVVHGLLRDLVALLDGLAANASAFMSGLQRTIDLQDVDEGAFVAYKDRLIGYLERFLTDLVVKSAEIARSLRELDGPDGATGGVGRLLRLAAAREAADVAPGQEPDAGEDGEAATRQKLAAWEDRWAGVRAWFLGDRAHPSQAALLRQGARAAIPELLAAVTVLQERRAGRSDRSADYRALARWFAEAPSDADAHRLWRAAFGLAPARHLTIDADTLADREREPIPAATSWMEAPAVVISPRLRKTGRHQRRGAPDRIADRTDSKRLLAAQLAAERTQTEAARRRLATGQPLRLRDLGTLDGEEFGLFLGLLGDALAAGPPDPDGIITTTTTDGSLEIVLWPTGDGVVAELHTPEGVFRGPDHVVTVTDLTTPMAVAALAPTLGGGR